MLISKFDLYKSEWLELVFDNRNKEYGAYDLRKHYDDVMTKSMIFTFLFISALLFIPLIFKSNNIANNSAERNHTTVITIHPVIPLVKPQWQVHHIKPAAVHPHVKPMPQIQTKTVRYVPFKVTPDINAITPPKNTDLPDVVIGPDNVKGTNTNGNGPITPSNTDNGKQGTSDNTVHNPFGLDVMPQPVGGNAAWAKFLGKNLRFPQQARDAGVSGRVIVSFIIEKDGSLSNITVLRSAGYGFDEEAVRVLKLAKAWKPGMQNGQPVRVKYELPVNFQLSDDSY